MKMRQPLPPLPEPLRGNNLVPEGATPSFAHYTITQRLPEIARRVIAENDLPPGAVTNLQTLIQEIPAGTIRPLVADPAPDQADWVAYVQPYLGQSWLHAPWFFVETYFYRRILEAISYFQEPDAAFDPFATQKRQGLAATRDATQLLCLQLDRLRRQPNDGANQFAHFLSVALWGNQADLSLWPTAGSGQSGAAPGAQGLDQQADQGEQRILVNDAGAVYGYLAGFVAAPTQIDFVLDNAGFELISDLALTDFLLSRYPNTHIHFHAKPHPTFVSDATGQDLTETLDFLRHDGDPSLRAWADRIQHYLQRKQLQMHTDAFWTSPLSMWEMPARLYDQLGHSTLLISKGDANYRRLLGDRQWPFTTRFADVVCYSPAPILALRTLKSEVVVGLQPGQAATVRQGDATWLTNGNWGLIQLAGGE